MRKFNSICILVGFFLVCTASKAQTPDSGFFDPDHAKENLPSSPTTSNIGDYSRITTDSYTGKVGVSVPIHDIQVNGLTIPITLTYDTGGVKVAQESNWIGLNWFLSGTSSITRNIQGNDDLNENVIPNSNGDISARVYNPIDVIIPSDDSDPYIPISEIENIHKSYAWGQGALKPAKLHADTQPDIFQVSLFGKNYRFRLDKRISGEDIVIGTHILNNTFAIITYDILNQSFTINDDRGFIYYFTTKNYAATMSSSRSTQANVSSNTTPEYTLQGILDDRDQKENTAITEWLLDTIVTPNGQTISYSYQEGAYFSFPKFNGNSNAQEGDLSLNVFNNNKMSANTYSSSMSITHINYLTNISGSFGQIEFNSVMDRKDLANGNDLAAIYPNDFSGSTFRFYTKTNQINTFDNNHGSTTGHYNLEGRRLETIDVKDPTGNLVKSIVFDNDSYFNDNTYAGTPNEARFLRLKLDGVSVNDSNYLFQYESPNSLPDKTTFDVDFWGFYNGAGNNTNIPKIGRFGTADVHQRQGFPTNPRQTLAQVFFEKQGANRGANFEYGNVGNLIKITYPTGGYSELEYESHTTSITKPSPYVITETFNDGELRWTSLLNEDNYNFTYQYLKYAKDPSYNFYDKVFNIENTSNGIPISVNQNISIQNPSLITGQGGLELFTANTQQDKVADIPKYYIQNLDIPAITYPLFYFRDWFNSEPGTEPPFGTASTFLPEGNYKLIREATIINSPAVILDPEDFNIYESSITNAYDLFSVGGARIKYIITKNNDHSFVNKKYYKYSFPIHSSGALSSGLLMNDLVFHSKFSGFHSYNPSRPATGTDGFRVGSNNLVAQDNSANGSHIGYSYVTEIELDKNNSILGKIERQFSNKRNYYYKESFDIYWDYNTHYLPAHIEKVHSSNAIILGMLPKVSYSYTNGNVLKEYIYDCKEQLRKEKTNYFIDGLINPDDAYYANFKNIPWTLDANENIPIWFLENETYITYKLPISNARKSLLSHTEIIDYYNDGSLILSESFNSYDEHLNLSETTSVIDNNNNNRITKKYSYPYSISVFNDFGMNFLRNDNNLNQIVKTEVFKNDMILNSSKLVFDNSSSTANTTQVTSIEESKGLNELSTKTRVEKYNSAGRFIQTRDEHNVATSYIWGYNNEHIVAKIVNATYSAISSHVANIIELSNSDNTSCLNNSSCIEQNLRDALADLRSSLPNSLVYSYTYNPLIGVSSITNERGETNFFEYNSTGKLWRTYDNNNNLISTNDYSVNNEILDILGQDSSEIIGCTDVLNDFPGDTIVESDLRITSTGVNKNGHTYKRLNANIDIINQMQFSSTTSLTYRLFPYGGSGSYEYRWKLKGGQFSTYSNNTDWNIQLSCLDLNNDQELEVICEVRDKELGVVELSHIRHSIKCND